MPRPEDAAAELEGGGVDLGPAGLEWAQIDDGSIVHLPTGKRFVLVEDDEGKPAVQLQYPRGNLLVTGSDGIAFWEGLRKRPGFGVIAGAIWEPNEAPPAHAPRVAVEAPNADDPALHRVLMDPALTPRDRMVLNTLVFEAGSDHSCTLGDRSLAEYSDLTERQVQRSLLNLSRLGYIGRHNPIRQRALQQLVAAGFVPHPGGYWLDSRVITLDFRFCVGASWSVANPIRPRHSRASRVYLTNWSRVNLKS